jgi:thiamine pyrophosphate-dependent acetolactate synthase large subunit-like protein
MVLFVGDVASDTRDREAFQEMDYTHFFGPSTKGMAKRVERVDDPERLPEYVARAFATAMNGRPGPVVLVLPEDMLTQPVKASPCPAWSRFKPGAIPALCARCVTCCWLHANPWSSQGGAVGRHAVGSSPSALCRKLAVACHQRLSISRHV